jgi:hypothetical protein
MTFRIVLAAAAAVTVLGSPVLAQTLTQPNPAPPIKTPSPAVSAKSRQAGHLKTCETYGAGFRNIPGTDACVKIGGGVTVDVGR